MEKDEYYYKLVDKLKRIGEKQKKQCTSLKLLIITFTVSLLPLYGMFFNLGGKTAQLDKKMARTGVEVEIISNELVELKSFVSKEDSKLALRIDKLENRLNRLASAKVTAGKIIEVNPKKKNQGKPKRNNDISPFFNSPYISLLLTSAWDWFAPKPPIKELPVAVRQAIIKEGTTFLTYEVNNGNLADQEVVLAALTRRLLAKYNQNKQKLTSQQIVEKVAKGWNPNKHKSLWAIKQHIKKRGSFSNANVSINSKDTVCKCAISNKSCECKKNDISANYATFTALTNAATLEFQTKTGKEAWEKKVTEFAHLKQYPKYYKKLKTKGKFKKGLKYPVLYASNPTVVKWSEKNV